MFQQNNQYDDFQDIVQAKQYQKEGRIQLALQHFDQAIKKSPEDSNLYCLLADYFKKLGRLSEAEKTYNLAIQYNKNNEQIYYQLANVQIQQNKIDESIENYNKCININDKFALAYNNIGTAYLKKNDKLNALQSYQKAIDLDPTLGESYFNLGNILQDLNCLRESLLAYLTAVKYQPKFDKAYNNMGNVLKKLNQTELAIKSFQTACEINPQHTTANSNRGNLLFSQGKYQQAIDAFNKAISLNKNDVLSLCKRGHSYIQLKQNGKASKDFLELNNLLKDEEIYKNISEANLQFIKQIQDNAQSLFTLNPLSDGIIYENFQSLIKFNQTQTHFEQDQQNFQQNQSLQQNQNLQQNINLQKINQQKPKQEKLFLRLFSGLWRKKDDKTSNQIDSKKQQELQKSKERQLQLLNKSLEKKMIQQQLKDRSPLKSKSKSIFINESKDIVRNIKNKSKLKLQLSQSNSNDDFFIKNSLNIQQSVKNAKNSIKKNLNEFSYSKTNQNGKDDTYQKIKKLAEDQTISNQSNSNVFLNDSFDQINDQKIIQSEVSDKDFDIISQIYQKNNNNIRESRRQTQKAIENFHKSQLQFTQNIESQIIQQSKNDFDNIQLQ